MMPLVVALLKMTLVLLVAFALSRALRHASAGLRHLVWFAALGALLALPPIAAWSPLEFHVLPATPVVDAPVGAPQTALVPTPTAEPAAVAEPMARSATAPATGAHAPSLGTMLFWLWAAGALLLLGRLLHGAWLVRRIVRRAAPLEHESWQVPLYEIADRLELADAPLLLRSDEVRMPFAAGLLSSVIVLPAESDGWTAERRSAVLIHELGHVRRRDLIGHTLGRVACALYWFHPMVWTAARELRAESERACDDLALSFGTRPSDYAEHLLDIVSSVRDHGTPAVALAMAHRREFEGRMLAILNPELRRLAPGRLSSALLTGSIAVLAVLVGAASPVPRDGATPAVSQGPAAALELRDVDETIQGSKHETTTTHETTATRRETVTSKSTSTRAKSVMPQRVASVLDSVASDSGRATVLARLVRTDASAEVRRVAAWGLQQYIDTSVAFEALVAALATDKDPEVREMAAWALASARRNTTAGAALAKALRDDRDPTVRATLVWAIGETRTCTDVQALVGALADSKPEVREVAAWSIGACRPARAPAALIAALGDAVPDVRLSAAWALYNIRDTAAVGALDAAFRTEKDEDVQEGLIHALAECGEPSMDALQRLVGSPDSNVRKLAVTALAKTDGLGPWPWPRPEPRPFP